MTLPNRLFRVDALVGYGWPECREQIQEHRTFATAQQAADWVAVLESMPSHHKLISVNRTDTAWLPVLPEELPPARVKRTQFATGGEMCVRCKQTIEGGVALVGIWDGDEPIAVAHAECPKVDA